MTGNKACLVIDAGGTYLKSAVLDGEGTVLEGSAFMAKSCSEGPTEKILRSFGETISHGLAFIEDGKMRLEGIGVAFPGPFDYRNGVPLMKHKFIAIYGVNLIKAFRKIPGILSNIPIRFIHDANAVLAGELWKGNAQGFSNAAVVTLGTGLGFAFSANNVIRCNELGAPALSIFKLPYKNGILEDYSAQRGFLRIYGEVSGNVNTSNIEVSDLGKWADEGNENCMRTFGEVGGILAESLQYILKENNIQCLLFGGQISRSFKHLEEALKKGLKDVKCLRKICMVKNIDSAALSGAFQALRPSFVGDGQTRAHDL